MHFLKNYLYGKIDMSQAKDNIEMLLPSSFSKNYRMKIKYDELILPSSFSKNYRMKILYDELIFYDNHYKIHV